MEHRDPFGQKSIPIRPQRTLTNTLVRCFSEADTMPRGQLDAVFAQPEPHRIADQHEWQAGTEAQHQHDADLGLRNATQHCAPTRPGR